MFLFVYLGQNLSYHPIGFSSGPSVIIHIKYDKNVGQFSWRQQNNRNWYGRIVSARDILVNSDPSFFFFLGSDTTTLLVQILFLKFTGNQIIR